MKKRMEQIEVWSLVVCADWLHLPCLEAAVMTCCSERGCFLYLFLSEWTRFIVAPPSLCVRRLLLYLEQTLCPRCLNYCPYREYSWSGKSLYPSFDLSTAGCDHTAQDSLKMLSQFWSEIRWACRTLCRCSSRHELDRAVLPFLGLLSFLRCMHDVW